MSLAPLAVADAAPEILIVQPANGATVSGTVVIAGEAHDDVGVKSVKVKIGEGPMVLATDTSGDSSWSTWTFSWDTAAGPNGPVVIHAAAFDTIGQGKGTEILVTVENPQEDAPPFVAITHPDDGATVSGVVLIQGEAGDDHEVVVVKVKIGDGPFKEATDTSGNGTWATWEYEWDTTQGPNGPVHIGALAIDSSGKPADDGINVIVENGHENKPPFVEIKVPANHATVKGTVEVKGHAGDPDDGDRVELVEVRVDKGEWKPAKDLSKDDSWSLWGFAWDTTTVEDGWHAFSARSFDGELYSEVHTFEYYVDNHAPTNHPPSAKVVHPKAGEVVSGIVLVHGTASDPDKGDRVTLVQVRIDMGDWRKAVDTSHDDSWSTWAYQWNTEHTENGHHKVCARAYDGDVFGEPSCVTVVVENDKTNAPPTVVIVHPENGETVEGVVLVHGMADDDREVKLVQIRFNDGEWIKTVDTSPDRSWTTWAYEWNTKGHGDGCLLLSARSWDGHLFSEVDAIEVCVENGNDPPRVEIVHPEDGEHVHGLVLVHGHASDDEEVKFVQVRIDSGDWRKAVNTGWSKPWSTWAYEWDTKEYENGEHQVCARAYDGELYSEPDCVVVFVENAKGGGAPPGEFQAAAPILGGAALGALGVAMLMLLRRHGFLRK